MKAARFIPFVGLVLLASGFAADNLVTNGDFSAGTDARGWPKSWQPAGDENVEQTLSLDRDAQRGACAKLACTRIERGTSSSHVMLAQSGVIALQKGKWYRLSFWARQEGMKGGALSVAISQTEPWGDTGIHGDCRVGRAWRQFQFDCLANKTVAAEITRLQIWHYSTGALWISDVRMIESDAPLKTYAPLLATEGRVNLIPNSSFECGKSGWGGITEHLGWGNLNDLIGEIDEKNSWHGGHSLRVIVNEKSPVFFFDYFAPTRTRVTMPLAANVGWIPVERGATYTLSAYAKANRAGVRGVLAVYFGDDPQVKKISLTADWQRYSFTLKAADSQCFIALGPDLRGEEKPDATVWLDAVQFEKASAPTDYAPADPVEIGVEKTTHVFAIGQPVLLGGPNSLLLSAFNNGVAPASVKFSARFEDFFDAPAGHEESEISVPAKKSEIFLWPTGLKKNGFYRVVIRFEFNGRTRETTYRLAIIEPYRGKDSLFGMNHAYPWDSQIKQIQQAGVLWMRDWSLKWQTVEPEPGRFDFTETDAQIERPLALGDKMLLLFPFPSANWSSAAPPSVRATRDYPAIRERMAYRPRDNDEFARYIEACVNHYKSRNKYWEVLNESLYTDYSLPRGHGYVAKDYVALLKTAYAAAKRADPKCFVIGGIAGSGGEMKLYEQLIKEGCLDSLDALNIHTYPGLDPPEQSEPWVARLNDLMRAAGKPKPLWLTEYGYYADDEPSLRPIAFEMPVLESEKLCAAYYVRFNTIMLANGVEKLFYHAGSSSRVNAEGLEGIFFRYGGAPRKMFVAQSAMANLFQPKTKFVEKLATPAGLRAYLFENPTGALLVAWAEEDHGGQLVLLDERLTALDVQGNSLRERRFALTEYPLYIQGRRLNAAKLKAAIQMMAE